MEDKDNQTQVDAPETPIIQPGETTQVDKVETEAEQPGGEDTLPKKEDTVATKTPTYTEEDLRKHESEITSKVQRELQAHKSELARLKMQEQIRQYQMVEQQARAKDSRDVESGLITEVDASQRARARQEDIQLNILRQTQRTEAEQLGRVMLAHDLAKKYGVDADALVKDEGITNPLQMHQKVLELALKKKDEELIAAKRKAETYDKGPGKSSDTPKTEEHRLKERYPSMYKK